MIIRIALIILLFAYATLIFAQEKAIIIPEVNLLSAIPKLSTTPEDRRLQVSHFSKKDILDSPVSNLTELFHQEQSIVRLTNNSGDPTQTALSIRGFGDNAAANSLILIDGFPLTNPSLLAPNINSVMLADVGHIDILQGSESVLWGDQAVGGVVSITTRHPKKLFASAIVNVGSYLQQGYRLLVGDKFEHGVFVKLFGILGRTDHYRRHNQQTDDNLSLEAGIDYARGSIAVGAQGYHTGVNFPGGLTEQQYRYHPRQATNDSNFINYHTQRFQLLSKHELTDEWWLESRLYTQETIGNGFVFASVHQLDRQSGFSPRLYASMYGQRVTLGYDVQKSDYHLQHRRVNSGGNALQQSVYLQDRFTKNAFDFTLGVRGANQSNHFQTATTSAVERSDHVWVSEEGIAFNPISSWSFFLRRAGSYSFPKINEQTLLPSGITYLKPQQGISYETGFTHLTEISKTQLNIYLLNLRNELAFNPIQTVASPFGSFSNLDKTVRRGITLTEKYQLNPAIILDGQLNYVDARFAAGLFNNKRIPAIPAFNANAGVVYQWRTHWQAKYTALFTGNRYASEDLANTGKRLSSYWLHDIALQYMLKTASVSVEALNIFDQRYPAYVVYNQLSQQSTYFTNPGRHYQLTIKVDLD